MRPSAAPCICFLLILLHVEKSCIRSDNSGGCFFLCPRGTNSSTSKKNCNKRRAGNGYWKETSKKQDVEDEETGEVIGTKRIFAYYEGNQKNGSKTDLALHEYHLTEAIPDGSIADPAEYSLCHVKKKKNQRKKDVSKKQQISRLSESPSCGAPYLIGTVKTPGPNLEVILITV
ncbi:hypothetical protein SAY87_014427 [Trapa incisa]|uniref:NAC domain-containing protein n=1 Tax=Trapa incisa TaxID=236973 RepID=A0AAN7GNM4_9MYRT|nr:hypothetical protein SAY87_014427 [Trapa incisa]